jgi:phasin family protein
MADQKTETHAPKAAEAAKAAIEAPARVAEAAARPAEKAVEAAAKVAAPAPKPAPAAAKAKPAAKRRAAPARKVRVAKPARKTAARKMAVRKAAVTRSVNKINRNVNEGTRTMKNEANKVADRFQAVFGDVNERARTQIERNTRIAEQLTELGKGNVEAIVASTKIAAKALETVGHEVAEYSRKSFEDASAALKGFAEVKSATDFFRLQSDYARTQFDALVAETSKLSETMIKLSGDVAEPLTSRYTVAAERVKAAVAA